MRNLMIFIWSLLSSAAGLVLIWVSQHPNLPAEHENPFAIAGFALVIAGALILLLIDHRCSR